MKKLIAMFGSLPPELRMLIAMAGFGTPIGIIIFLKTYIFKDKPLWMVVLGVALVVAVLSFLGWVISKIFGRARRQRTKKLEKELASTSEAGPVSMDLRAAIKANNEKFFTAIREMKRLGISVYDLPWYVVIGDSGCGKTKLINEGGLTFSTGKPEGYQLGTLNYNWWFTEDAIFIDMAGRLCNPQDDADYREWESFLRTIAQGRRGYPINGVLACVSAEHLLQDPPEKLEQDANTMLERLRDLQSKLNVTFATYLVVTKCDKILGFMQFFDRAERDITIKNQIFGFSRPGDFHELYDPERFGTDFDGVYNRLNELRLRRLQDDVDETELGLAYSFPEEFRQLREPLQIYVRTLFPAIKSPRAVKNLIFRGVYFTSATQQGGLILRHLTERLGQDAANQFQPLESLYPRPRPHFVKELLFRKVFPEQGLVFRNEQEVMRNRKLARVLTVGGTALTVLLLVLLGISSYKFGKLIAEPRERARLAPQMVDRPAEALQLAGLLGRDVEALRRSIWPTILSLGPGAGKPAEDLTRVQVGLFENAILRPVLRAAEEGLRSAKLVPESAKGGGVPFPAYLAALEQYLLWRGCAGRETLPDTLDYGGFEKLCAVLPDAPSPLLSQRKEILAQAQTYFLTVRGLKGARNPSRWLTGDEAATTIRTAIRNVHTYAERYATLSEENPDPVIREWMRIRNRCDQIQSAYAAMVAAASSTVETQEQLESFRAAFEEQYARFTQAMDECAWRGERGAGFLRIPSLREAIKKQRQTWLDRQKTLLAAYLKCPGGASGDAIAGAITALVGGDGVELRGLDRALADSIRAAGLSERDYFPEYFGEAFDQLVREVDEAYAHILTVRRAGDAAQDDQIILTEQLRTVVRPVLDRVHERLATLVAGGRQGETAAEWVATMQRLLYPASDTDQAAVSAASFAKLDPRWEGDKLARLSDAYQTLIRKDEGTVLLRTMEERLQRAATMGLGELAADWRKGQPSPFTIPIPVVAEGPVEPKKEKEAPAGPPPMVKAPAGPPPMVAPPKGSGAPAPAVEPARAPSLPQGTGQIPRCMAPEFWNDRAREFVLLLYFLKQFGPEYYFSRASDPSPLHERCANLLEAAWKGYCEQYAGAWDEAYKSKCESLAALKRVGKWDGTWEQFAGQFRPSAVGESEARNAVRDEVQPALEAILQAMRWPGWSSQDGWWPDPTHSAYGPQNRRVTELWEQAVQSRWTGGTFVRKAAAKGAATEARPWSTLAAEFAARWVDWCNATGQAARLPRKFDTEEAGKALAIPWADIPALRDSTGLADERLTGQLVAFQQQAQALLSAELTAILAGVQADFFGDQVPFEGWPYINEKDTTGPLAVETVAFDRFTSFLAAIQRAEAALGPLDKDLPAEDPVRQARQTFLRSCREWREFLQLRPQGGATPLRVLVWIEDPLSGPSGRVEVRDTTQHYYAEVCLGVGLRPEEAGATVAAQPICFPTRDRGSANRKTAIWEWSGLSTTGEMTFQLRGGLTHAVRNYTYPELKPQVIGRLSPLAFCAYLHRYGRYYPENNTWVVTHAVNLPELFKEAGHPEYAADVPGERQIVGDEFVFELPADRKLPGPVVRLSSPRRESSSGS